MFDPIEYINEPRWHEMSLGLERIEELLEGLGNPQDRLDFIHVAGTNGKGSTCSLVASVLQRSGFRVGMFTSPYIVRFEERIRVDGQDIPYEDLKETTLRVRSVAERMKSHPTEFELMTAVAFSYFAARSCDIVIAEVGLGGRLDSTNVIDSPLVCAITPISYDHCGLLGSTLGAIAREKAGIIKEGSRVVSAPQETEAQSVLRDVAQKKGALLSFVDPSSIEGDNDSFSYKNLKGLSLSLKGSYQLVNASVALEVVFALREQGWSIDDEALRSGLREARWPGRFEVIEGQPSIVIDGGHNPQGARELAVDLAKTFPGKRIAFIVGVLADKDHAAMLASWAPLASLFVCVDVPNPRTLAASELAAEIEGLRGESSTFAVEVLPDVEDALGFVMDDAASYDVVCFCGSLYGIGAFKEALASRLP